MQNNTIRLQVNDFCLGTIGQQMIQTDRMVENCMAAFTILCGHGGNDPLSVCNPLQIQNKCKDLVGQNQAQLDLSSAKQTFHNMNAYF